MEYRGYNGAIVVDEAQLTINHTGIGAKIGGLAHDQPRAIPLQAISGVRLKQASRMVNGYLTLGVGGAEVPELNAGTIASDPNTVLFRHKDKDHFQSLHDWLVTVIDRNQAEGIDPSTVAFDEAGETRLERMQSKADSLQQSSGEMPAGWFPDPQVPGQQRYWDGKRWTDERASSAPQAAQVPAGQPPMSSVTPPNSKKSSGLWWKIALGVVGFFIIVGAIGNLGSDSSDTDNKAAPSKSPEPTSTSTSDSTPKPSKTSTPKPEPELTVSQENAIKSAESYLDYSSYSKRGLIDQLSSEYGEGFPRKDAEFAVNNIEVDWKAEAVESAESYLEYSSYSRQGLIDQLTSEHGEKFTMEQAVYAVNEVGL